MGDVKVLVMELSEAGAEGNLQRDERVDRLFAGLIPPIPLTVFRAPVELVPNNGLFYCKLFHTTGYSCDYAARWMSVFASSPPVSLPRNRSLHLHEDFLDARLTIHSSVLIMIQRNFNRFYTVIMALSRRRGTLEPLSSSGFNQRQSMGMPSRGVSRTSLGPNFDKVSKPQVRLYRSRHNDIERRLTGP
jgi:hypothetical protein